MQHLDGDDQAEIVAGSIFARRGEVQLFDGAGDLLWEQKFDEPVTAVFGALLGLGSALFTLLFMAVKTGLHAHGPEFTAEEVNWVVQQIPLWTVVGLLGGLGLGLLLKAVATRSE